MKRISIIVAAVIVSFFCSVDVCAQLSSLVQGRVYHFVNAGNNAKALGAADVSDVEAADADDKDIRQHWYVEKEGSSFRLRSLANGRYLNGSGTSESWTLTEDGSNSSCRFTLYAVGANNTIRSAAHSNNTYAYMHRDNSNNIVGWESGNSSTQWSISEIAYTPDEIQDILDRIAGTTVSAADVERYQGALDVIFSDKACTRLNASYSSMSATAMESDSHFRALPETLKAAVRKVKSGDWSEANAVETKPGWNDEYARRFRVQMYEPYSIEGEITSVLRFNAHSNMDNPTGIYANGCEVVYVMVEGNIEDGAELWIADKAGLGATNYYNHPSYTRLHEGLNAVPYFADGSQLWINYVVHTYDSNHNKEGENPYRKISDYKPLKIHIEGGHINGYYNAIGDFRAADSGTDDLWGEVDNDADWDYCKVRAPLNGTDAPNRDFPLLGHRQTLLFPLGDVKNDAGGMENGLLHHLENLSVPSVPYSNSASWNDYIGMGLDSGNGKINIMIEAWDRIMYSQLATMGLLDNAVMEKMNDMYPRWTADGAKAEIYNYGKAADGKDYVTFCGGIDYSEYFNHHGAAVGAPGGYMSGGWRVCNYHYNTMSSIIGSIASEAGPTWGPAHEIGHQHQSVFNLNGQTEVTNNLFANIAVWYMGMGTSRHNGSQGSLESVLEAFNTDGNDLYTNNIWAITQMYYRLWLYYHLAGNNTQFWPRLFELCRREPIVNGGQISGETSLLRFYQHACTAAGEDLTEFFRVHGFFEVMENRQVEDYSNATYNVTQAQIDAAISAVKAKGYPLNYAAIFINDGTDRTTVQHDGKTRRALWDGNPTAEYGSVNDFISGNEVSVAACTAILSNDGEIVVSGGEGAVGFLLVDENGETISFSNNSLFALSAEALELVTARKASLLAVDAKNSLVSVDIVSEDEATLELKELIKIAEELIAEVADVRLPGSVALPLQCSNASGEFYISSNAGHNSEDGNASGNKDGSGIAGLLDNDASTYFHSRWGGTPVNEPHYLQVDLGSGNEMDKFCFEYATRKAGSESHTSPAPTRIEVYAWNGAVQNSKYVAAYTGKQNSLPSYRDLGVSWSSPVVNADTKSRYLRFTVELSEGPGGAQWNNQYFFAMGTFRLYNGETIVEALNSGYGKVDVQSVKDLGDALFAANVAVKNLKGVEDSGKALKLAYDALQSALAENNLPIVLTTDAGRPHLYKIRINRSGNTVLQYDPETQMVLVANDDADRCQAWYFMRGTDEGSYDDILIFPYWGGNEANAALRLGSDNITDGNSRVKAVDGSESGYKTNWYITFKEGATAEGWWNIQPEGKGSYFSNHGGVTQKMGFYNNAGDDGSEFQFVPDSTDYDRYAYLELKDAIKEYGAEKSGGSRVGQYTVESAEKYNAAYLGAEAVLGDASSDAGRYIAARKALEEAYAVLECNMPADGLLYRLRSAYKGQYSEDRVVYVGESNELYFSGEGYDVSSSRAIWQFVAYDGGYALRSMHTGEYVTVASWGAQVVLSKDPAKVVLDVLDGNDAILRINTQGYPLHAQNSGSKVVGWSGGLNSASAWYIDELTESETAAIHYPYTMSRLGYGTLMLGFDAAVPDGVTASYAASLDGNVVEMVSVGDVIPANTPVILSSNTVLDGNLDVSFLYSGSEGEAIDGNMLRGTLYRTVVKCDDDGVNNNIYMMQSKDGVVKMYWMYENYNADGERVADENGSYNHDDGGYVMNSANRAYLVVPQSMAQNSAAYSFGFGGTTGMMPVVDGNGAESMIYDLQGRRLDAVRAPGIYIVNGRKVSVKK